MQHKSILVTDYDNCDWEELFKLEVENDREDS